MPFERERRVPLVDAQRPEDERALGHVHGPAGAPEEDAVVPRVLGGDLRGDVRDSTRTARGVRRPRRMPPRPRAPGLSPPAATKFWKTRSISEKSRERQSEVEIRLPSGDRNAAREVECRLREAQRRRPRTRCGRPRRPAARRPPSGCRSGRGRCDDGGPGADVEPAAPVGVCRSLPLPQRSARRSTPPPESPVPGSPRSAKNLSSEMPVASTLRSSSAAVPS